jgi:hypothetical protein
MSDMTDFYTEASHGALGLSVNKVIGWYQLDKNLSDYSQRDHYAGVWVQERGPARQGSSQPDRGGGTIRTLFLSERTLII